MYRSFDLFFYYLYSAACMYIDNTVVAVLILSYIIPSSFEIDK
jgi:hypothetical protein